MSGFRKFLMRGNLVDLAVAVVIGVAFNAVVQALIGDVVTPLIAGTAKKPTFAAMTAHVGRAVISYVTAAAVYYLLVAPTNRITAYAQRNKAATERECPDCLSQIPVGARRCMYCTSAVQPVSQPQNNGSSAISPTLDKLRRHLL